VKWDSELYVAKLRLPRGQRYRKSLSLEEIEGYLNIVSYGKSYEEYVSPALLTFTEDLDALKGKLCVCRIHPMGLFIRGIYGGEEKKGAKKYAGLALVDYSQDNVSFEFKLYNTEKTLVVPLDLLKYYDVKVFKMLYVGEVNPFRIVRYINVLLSKRGEEKLKQFLREALELNKRNISPETQKKVEDLIAELQQPDRIKPLDVDKYYTVFRSDRIFTACALKPEDEDIIVHSQIGFIESESEQKAYYYAAIFNYLAFKAVEHRRAFTRHQFRKAPIAVYVAGLSWCTMDDSIREEIVKLSKELHRKAPNREYPNQRVALKDIARLPEFRELVRILDSKVNRENLEEALNIVSGTPDTSAEE
jgi:hypothetical protein